MAQRKLPKIIYKEVKDFIQILKADALPISSVYVFGSYAKGNQHKDSDVDVCVVSPKFKNPSQALKYLWRMRPINLQRTIEPLGFSPKDMNDKYSTLIAEIKKYGIKV